MRRGGKDLMARESDLRMLSGVVLLMTVFSTLVTQVDGKHSPSQQNQAINCNEEISSQKKKNGSIESPFYPNPYSAGVTCTYNFVGVGRERVKLQFVHMDLYYEGGLADDPVDCSGSDNVKVMIPLQGELKELGVYCGKKLPPILMSAGNKMTVTFQSESSSKGLTTGFKAMYSFVTNFGITSGEPDPRGVCSFQYHSYKSSQGSFSSPNYPGLYPRNTECHYLFFGKGKETVEIMFPFFKVDGIAPKCGRGTHSDYVSFSNFAQAEDRKLHRLCGTINDGKKQSIESDGPFFRVVFKSNDIYDDEGFFAYYQFKGMENNPSPTKTMDGIYNVTHFSTSTSEGEVTSRSNTSVMSKFPFLFKRWATISNEQSKRSKVRK